VRKESSGPDNGRLRNPVAAIGIAVILFIACSWSGQLSLVANVARGIGAATGAALAGGLLLALLAVFPPARRYFHRRWDAAILWAATAILLISAIEFLWGPQSAS